MNYIQIKQQYPKAFNKLTDWIFELNPDCDKIKGSRSHLYLCLKNSTEMIIFDNKLLIQWIAIHQSTNLIECLKKINN